MKRLLSIAALLWSCAFAQAADNAVTLTVGSGVTMRTVDVGSAVQSSMVILGGSTGTAIYGTAGTANSNVLTIQGIASGTTVPVSGTLTGVTTVSTVTTLTGGGVASGSADSGNPLKVGGKYNSSPVTLTDGNRGDLQLDVNGYVKVNVTNTNVNGQATMANSSPVVIASNQSAVPVTLTSTTISGTVAATQSGTWTVQPGNTANTTPWLQTPVGTSSSALALTDLVCGSGVSSCVLKASAGNLYGVYAECSAACWLMVFNSTSAPSNGSTTAGKASGNMVECIAIPAGDQRSLNYPVFPINYSVGITVAISSTTCATLTLATTGFVHGTVQ